MQATWNCKMYVFWNCKEIGIAMCMHFDFLNNVFGPRRTPAEGTTSPTFAHCQFQFVCEFPAACIYDFNLRVLPFHTISDNDFTVCVRLRHDNARPRVLWAAAARAATTGPSRKPAFSRASSRSCRARREPTTPAGRPRPRPRAGVGAGPSPSSLSGGVGGNSHI